MGQYIRIDRNTTLADLKAQYQEQSRRLHPDASGGSDREFARMQAEYRECVRTVEERMAKRARIDGVVRGVCGVLSDVMQAVHDDPSSLQRFAERLRDDRPAVEREVGEVATRFGRELVRTLIGREEA